MTHLITGTTIDSVRPAVHVTMAPHRQLALHNAQLACHDLCHARFCSRSVHTCVRILLPNVRTNFRGFFQLISNFFPGPHHAAANTHWREAVRLPFPRVWPRVQPVGEFELARMLSRVILAGCRRPCGNVSRSQKPDAGSNMPVCLVASILT